MCPKASFSSFGFSCPVTPLLRALSGFAVSVLKPRRGEAHNVNASPPSQDDLPIIFQAGKTAGKLVGVCSIGVFRFTARKPTVFSRGRLTPKRYAITS